MVAMIGVVVRPSTVFTLYVCLKREPILWVLGIASGGSFAFALSSAFSFALSTFGLAFSFAFALVVPVFLAVGLWGVHRHWCVCGEDCKTLVLLASTQ